MDTGFDCLHSERDFVVAVKPAGLLSVPGRGEAGADHLAGRVQRAWPDALVVHRLDMATSGLMLFARGPAAQRVLSRLFEQRLVDKRYEAVVHGLPADDAGAVDLPLGPDWPNRPRQQVDLARGRPALTHWRVLARDPARRRTRLALAPVTGRSHQLRVHLAAIGHPIVGDALYGPDAEAVPADAEGLEAANGAPRRLLLHACSLAFDWPAEPGDVAGVTARRRQFQHAAPF
jgi:tRNA pseudouridine32 synthase/23S rRNA pseudouridine746 synthase